MATLGNQRSRTKSLVGVLKDEKRIDVLINAAGITHYSSLFVTSVDLLEEIVQTNLMGCIVACREVGKRMIGNRTSGGGLLFVSYVWQVVLILSVACIINVASLLGMKGGQGSVGYASSKAGVIGLTRALAAEVGKANIRVNVIVPGYIETKMTTGMFNIENTPLNLGLGSRGPPLQTPKSILMYKYSHDARSPI